MHPLQFLVPVGGLEAAAAVLPWVVLVLALASMATRFLGHRQHVRQAREGDDDDLVERYTPHSVAMVALMLASFAFTIVEPHGGVVLSTLVIGTFLADFFEFESRRVEARNDMEFEQPKASIGASMLVLGYAAFQALFQYVAPVWNAVV
jgi:ABC-type Fe3+ transport system permease subunit